MVSAQLLYFWQVVQLIQHRKWKKQRYQNSLPVEITEIKEEPTQITQAQEATVDPFADWQSYTNENFRIKIKYPSTWFGPDVYEVDNEIRLAIGSDKVYPYGTDRTEQIYQVINSYYITIRYQENPGYASLDEYSEAQLWLSTYLSMLNMEDGKSTSNSRAIDIKVRNVELGKFSGLEYITTLSETAQTEPVFIRQLILFDEQLNALMIMGSPNNVEIPINGNWREAYQSVDRENLEILYKVLELIVIE